MGPTARATGRRHPSAGNLDSRPSLVRDGQTPATLPPASFPHGSEARRDVVQLGPELDDDTLTRLIGPVEGKRVLDLGCGDGTLAAALAHAGAQVTAGDVAAVGANNVWMFYGDWYQMGLREKAGLVMVRDIYSQDGRTLLKYRQRFAYATLQAEALLRGTVRTFKNEVRDTIIRRLQELAASLQPAFGVTVNYQFIPGVPATISTSVLAIELSSLCSC